MPNRTKAPQVRPLHPGMGQAVAERTVLRKLDPADPTRIVPYDELQEGAEYRWETWAEVATRVATGNALLCPDELDQNDEFLTLQAAISAGKTLMSGRHLQHGDSSQPERNIEVFTNCATAANTFSSFYLLLNGSGVGRSFDSDMMLVNWDNAPHVICVLDTNHPDFVFGQHISVRDAKHLYGTGKDVLWFEVPDTREGWAQALELWENAAFQKIHRDKLLILDFSKVRPKGAPIKGMQNRPSSGPVPLMNAFANASKIKGANLGRWLQAMYMDHYFAECVLVGGARRAARMSVMYWKDENVLDFIRVKRPIEYAKKNRQQVIDYRAERAAEGLPPLEAFLWSSNNSVGVDDEFWTYVKDTSIDTDDAKWARKVYKLVIDCQYGDGTGEPGLINLDKLNADRDGFKALAKQGYVGGPRYEPFEDTELYLHRLVTRAQKKKYFMIVNPCGEIPLSLLGGYCTIADVVPYHCDNLVDFENVARAVTRALIRVNTLGALYGAEVARTNRIGVGLTGIHEYAWKFYGLTFEDLIDESKSELFWDDLKHIAEAVQDEADRYSAQLGVNPPHTFTTVKPSGTVSKLFGLTEGWHLPAMKFYVRWVQFRNDDPLVETYRASGYPTRELVQYAGHTIVGFPTQPVLSDIMPEEKIVTAGEASPEDQFKWLQLGEKYWINGGGADRGGQISYTLKYKPDEVDFATLNKMTKEYMPSVRCCSIMPQSDSAAYEYQPEETVTKAHFEQVANAIQQALAEDIGKEHVDCDSGACPVDFNADRK